MEMLALNCSCGQEMVVPQNALGRTGLCPGCGGHVAINDGNTRPYRPRRRENGNRALALRRHEAHETQGAREDAWRNFAAAVDLYNSRRYAEALAMLDTLLRQFPGNPHVQTARDQCIVALERVTQSGVSYDGKPVDDAVLSPELVKSIVLDKLLHGASEEVQLKAAQLAAQLLGMLDHPEKATTALSPDPVPALSLESAGSRQSFLNQSSNGHDRKQTAPREASVPSATGELPDQADLESIPGRNQGAEDTASSSPEIRLVLPEPYRRDSASPSRFPKKVVFE